MKSKSALDHVSNGFWSFKKIYFDKGDEDRAIGFERKQKKNKIKLTRFK